MRLDPRIRMTHGSSQGSFVRPSEALSGVDISCWDIQFFRPFNCNLRTAIKRHSPITSPVSALLFSSSPANVVRLVIAVVVDTLDFMLSSRTQSNVRIESREISSPLFAYGNSSSTIVNVSGIGLTQAPRFYFRPNVELGNSCLTVLDRLRHAWALTARRSTKCRKVSSAYVSCFPAPTQTTPINLIITSPLVTKSLNDQVSIYSALGYIDSSWHVLTSIKNVLTARRATTCRAISILARGGSGG